MFSSVRSIMSSPKIKRRITINAIFKGAGSDFWQFWHTGARFTGAKKNYVHKYPQYAVLKRNCLTSP